jgi:hypothetical protein
MVTELVADGEAFGGAGSFEREATWERVVWFALPLPFGAVAVLDVTVLSELLCLDKNDATTSVVVTNFLDASEHHRESASTHREQFATLSRAMTC